MSYTYAPNAVALDEESGFVAHSKNWKPVQSVESPNAEGYVFIRVPLINGVPQLPMGAGYMPQVHGPTIPIAQLAVENDDYEEVPVSRHIRRALRIIPFAMVVVLIVLWSLCFTVAYPNYDSFFAAIFSACIAGLATVFAFYQIPVSFVGRNWLRVGFWIAIVLAAAYIALIIVGFLCLDVIGAPICLVLLGLHISWICVAGVALRRVCCCTTDKNCC